MGTAIASGASMRCYQDGEPSKDIVIREFSREALDREPTAIVELLKLFLDRRYEVTRMVEKGGVVTVTFKRTIATWAPRA